MREGQALKCYRWVCRVAGKLFRWVTLTHLKQEMCTKADGFALTALAIGARKGLKNVFLFSRRMHLVWSPAPRARKDAVLAVLSLWALSGTVGWGQELTWLLHKVSFISTHVTWPVATPPPAAILSALPSKAGLGQVIWGIGRVVEEKPDCAWSGVAAQLFDTFLPAMVPGFATCRMPFPWVSQLAMSVPVTAYMKVEEGSLTQQRCEKIQWLGNSWARGIQIF